MKYEFKIFGLPPHLSSLLTACVLRGAGLCVVWTCGMGSSRKGCRGITELHHGTVSPDPEVIPQNSTSLIFTRYLILVNHPDLIGHGWRTFLGRVPKLSANFRRNPFPYPWEFKKKKQYKSCSFP